MKKSEAINIIYELLEDFKKLDIGNLYLAEEIVNKLEDIGMRPPRTGIVFIPKEFMQEFILHNSLECKWEPEKWVKLYTPAG